MVVAQPTGEYVEQMLEPGGWPEVDEDALGDRADVFRGILQQLTRALEGWQHERAEIFDGGIWSGGAASAANGKIGKIVEELTGLQNDVVKAITWYNNTRSTVTQTKTTIAERVQQAQQQIGNLENQSDGDADDRADAIAAMVKQVHGENVSDVSAAAGKVPAASTWKPTSKELEQLLNQKTPLPSTKPDPTTPPASAPGSPSPAGTKGAQGGPPGGTPQAPVPTASDPSSPAGASNLRAGQSGTPAAATSATSGSPGVTTKGAQVGPDGGTPLAPTSGAATPVATNPQTAPGGVAPAGPTAPSPAMPRSLQMAPPPTAGTPETSPPTASAGPAPSTPKGFQTPAYTPGTPGGGGPGQSAPAQPVAQPSPAPVAPAPPTHAVPPISAPSIGAAAASGAGGGQLNSVLGAAYGDHSGVQQSPLSDAWQAEHQPPDTGQHRADGLGQGRGQALSGGAPLGSTAAQAPLTAAESVMTAPAAVHGPPMAPEALTAETFGGSTAAGVSGGGHGGGSGGNSGGGGAATPPVMSSGGTSAPPITLGPPPTPPPAGPAHPGSGTPGTPSGPGGPGVHPASTSSTSQGSSGGSVTSPQAEAAPAPIPVSSARTQKDAIAEATRRQTGGGDVQMAYRVAAALNAADIVNKADFRFFWMTAVTADGEIVVANSYGLAYIPEKVALPAQVNMASADGTIPLEERAHWATYPNLALQGWAAHHNTTLRVVIAKQEHFAGIDLGSPQQFVANEDIPTSGKMQGRSRLEVIAPEDAARLASVSDLALIDMLPPAPVDATPPADQRSTLWWELMKHLMSSDADRGVAHLQAFAAYAAHAQDLAIHQAYTAVHVVEQRAAVADWLYWQHIAGLLNDALAGAGQR